MKKTKLNVGDVFDVELAPNEMLEARIILDVDAQCIRPRRLATGSPLRFFEESFLVEVLHGSDVLIPGVFVHADKWQTTGKRDVVPERIDFPQTTTLVGPRPHFAWGEVLLPLAISVDEHREINAPPAVSPVATLVPLSLYRLARQQEIDSSRYQAPELFDPGRIDIRFSAHAERIRGLLAARIEDGYFATAMRYGYDPRRFYEQAERVLILCPYCSAPIEASAISCTTCARDVRNDAPLEMSNVELALARRAKCRSCEGPMLEGASVCPGCKSSQ